MSIWKTRSLIIVLKNFIFDFSSMKKKIVFEIALKIVFEIIFEKDFDEKSLFENVVFDINNIFDFRKNLIFFNWFLIMIVFFFFNDFDCVLIFLFDFSILFQILHVVFILNFVFFLNDRNCESVVLCNEENYENEICFVWKSLIWK